MERRSRRIASLRNAIGFGAVMLGCNALLDNEERSLYPGTGGRSGVGGGESHRRGAAGSGFGEAGDGGARGGAHAEGGAGAPSNGDAGNGGHGNGEAGGNGSVGNGGVGLGNVAGGTAAGNGGRAASGGSTSGGKGSAGDGGAGGASCVCTAGNTEQQKVACGTCGSAFVTRTCGDDCQWGAYGPPGSCTVPTGACTPGQKQTDVGHCANGGWRDRERTCNANCSWGNWTDTSACQHGQNECSGCACVSWCEDPKTNGGSTCLWIGCSESAARAECQADLKDTCGTTNQPLTFTDWRPN